MNREIREYFSVRGFYVSGNEAFGSFEGYEVSFCENNFNLRTPYIFTFNGYAEKGVFDAVIDELKSKKIAHASYEYTKIQLIVGLNDIAVFNLVDRLDAVLNEVALTLRKHNVRGSDYCPFCGEEFNILQDTKIINIKGTKITVHASNCYDELKKCVKEEFEKEDAKPNKYGMGFLGALIGGAVGAILTFFIALVGYVASISSIVGFLVSTFLYRKFGGKPDARMYVTCALCTILEIYLVVFYVFALEADLICYKSGIDYQGLVALNFCLSNDIGFRIGFLIEIVLHGLFVAISVGGEIIRTKRSLKKKQTI